MKFRIKTILVASAGLAAIASIARYDVPSLITGIGLLFVILVFGEDIWPQLRG